MLNLNSSKSTLRYMHSFSTQEVRTVFSIFVIIMFIFSALPYQVVDINNNKQNTSIDNTVNSNTTTDSNINDISDRLQIIK